MAPFAPAVPVILLLSVGIAHAQPIRFLEKDPGTKVPIAFKASLAPEAVRANEFARVQVAVEIGAPWYIFALRPDPGGGPPSRMIVEDGPFQGTGRYSESRPQELSAPETGGSIRVHRETGTFWTDVRVPKTAAPGPLVIRGTLEYAACNGNICLPLRREPFRIEARVAEGASRQVPSRRQSDAT